MLFRSPELRAGALIIHGKFRMSDLLSTARANWAVPSPGRCAMMGATGADVLSAEAGGVPVTSPESGVSSMFTNNNAVRQNVGKIFICQIQKLCYTNGGIGNEQRVSRELGCIEHSRFFFCICGVEKADAFHFVAEIVGHEFHTGDCPRSRSGIYYPQER